MKVTLNPYDYAPPSPDAPSRADRKWEAVLETMLRSVPEEERVDFLSQVLVLREKTGWANSGWFALAMRVLESHSSYERVLRAGLPVADASTIKGWLECCVQRIGMRRVVHVLREEDRNIPQQVNLTAYWLPQLARTPKERAIVKEFLGSRRKAIE